VSRHHDYVKSDGVLQQPHVNVHERSGTGSHDVEHLVVNVEHGHNAQGDQRHGHRHAEQVDQHVDVVPDQPVPDP